MDVTGGIGRAVHKKKRFSHTAVLPDRLVGIMGAPVCLHLTLDLFDIEVRGNLFHKTPLACLDTTGVREQMLAPQHKVVFHPLTAGPAGPAVSILPTGQLFLPLPSPLERAGLH
jgi:hypothetical protein